MATSRQGMAKAWRTVARIGVPVLWAVLLLRSHSVPAADAAPAILSTWPASNAQDVALEAATNGSLSITFSEPVTLQAGVVEVACARSGLHVPTVSGGPVTFSFISNRMFLPGESCTMSVMAELVSDLDDNDPPDHLSNSVIWSFHATSHWIVINELDAISAHATGEFVELYDGGRGNVALDGLSLVIYDEARGPIASLAVGLDGYKTDANGYFVIGDPGAEEVDFLIANGSFYDAMGAVAVYDGAPDEFRRKPPPLDKAPVDAIVYGAAGQELMALLRLGESALDENGRGMATQDSNQRCPNGAGLPQTTASFLLDLPTPGRKNACPVDSPPEIVTVTPAPGARNVPLDATIEIEFSEPVLLGNDAVMLICSISGTHTYTIEGHGALFSIAPDHPLAARESCTVTVFAEKVTDVDSLDPPDYLTTDYIWSFSTVRPVATNVMINEVDSDTPGADTAEFIELFDGGAGRTALDGLAIVLFNGQDDRSYLTIELEGNTTDEAGYFIVGNVGVAGVDLVFANKTLQNGPDAVALVAGNRLDYPDGTPVAETVPLDAFVYGGAANIDSGLLPLLEPNQPQVDENGRGAVELHSNQRCPNGEGGLRMTAGYKQNTPTLGMANNCVTDGAPLVKTVSPANGASGIPIHEALTVEFTEPVTLTNHWLSLTCSSSGAHIYQVTGGPSKFTIKPATAFHYSESCSATIYAHLVSDIDTDDPPDQMVNDLLWTFTTIGRPADFVVINEIDSDTPGNDMAEFIELFDGGIGNTRLDGLALVFFDGKDDRSYRAIDLDGQRTDERGYFVIGNSAVSPDIVIPNGALQNGPDAVALYAGDASQFPSGTLPQQTGLVDAIVYGKASSASVTLLKLLLAGQTSVDENSRGAADAHSLQRCPNGEGGQRQTKGFIANGSTPGMMNYCLIDDPPTVVQTRPVDGAAGIDPRTTVWVRFSEDVVTKSNWFSITCGASGAHLADVVGGPREFTLTPKTPFEYGEKCDVTLSAAKIADVDDNDPPDQMAADFKWSFRTASAPPVAEFVVLNELDTDTPGSDTAEFIELYDGGIGHTNLDGLIVVFWDGGNDRSYRVINLLGFQTDANGYFLLGNAAVPGVDLIFADGELQNGPDAIGLYAGRPPDFSPGTIMKLTGLVDAIVYGPADKVDSGLLTLLETGQTQLDEAARGDSAAHSLQRCPNGAGGARRTEAYRPEIPTPGEINNCRVDEPPIVVSYSPARDAVDVLLGAPIDVEFSEDVTVDENWFEIECDASGSHEATVAGDRKAYQLVPVIPFSAGEMCQVTLYAANIHDADIDDPPDNPPTDVVWQFHTVQSPLVHFTSNSPVWIGDEAIFRSVVDAAGSFVMRWDFGDGSAMAEGASVSHHYAAVGSYTVRLEVSGPAGTIDYSEDVVVRPRMIYLSGIFR